MTAPAGPDPLLTATPADVERGIAREMLKHPETLSAADVAAAAMTVVGPVLEAKDAEIKRQHDAVAAHVMGVATQMFEQAIQSAMDTVVAEKLAGMEAAIRAGEREHIIALLRTEVTVQRIAAMELPGPLAEEATAEAASYEAAIGLLTAWAKGLAVDIASAAGGNKP